MSKILISGTGRAGTTFLIKLFTFLGFDTGFDKNTYMNYIFENCNAGMELPYTSNHYILKNPQFMTNIEDIIQNIKIKYMIIPIRDYEKSAESRANIGHGPNKNGGLFGARNKDEQILFYHKIMANYLFYMTKYDINTIFIDFDRMISDKVYLFNKLKIILNEKNININTFSANYNYAASTSKPIK
jgi:hypothetical protein